MLVQAVIVSPSSSLAALYCGTPSFFTSIERPPVIKISVPSYTFVLKAEFTVLLDAGYTDSTAVSHVSLSWEAEVFADLLSPEAAK